MKEEINLSHLPNHLRLPAFLLIHNDNLSIDEVVNTIHPYTAPYNSKEYHNVKMKRYTLRKNLNDANKLINKL